MNRRLALGLALDAPALALLPSLALAQAYSAKPITVIVPFAVGGGSDNVARMITAKLGERTGRSFVIDNRGGAGGTVGATIAAKAAPDGYTFFMGAVHHTIAPSMYPRLDYNLETDFIPVGLVASVPQVVVVNPQRVPAKDLKALLEMVRAKPGQLNYGSAGNGTSHHLAGELFKLQSKTFITHIPYRGAGPALQDLIAGQVDIMFDGMGSSAAHIKAGRIKAFAVAAERRAPGFNDLPTCIEAGGPDYKVSTWYGIWAPKNTPKEAVDRMQAEMKKAFAADDIKATWNGMGADTPNLFGDEFGKFVASETKRWAEVVKASGAKLD
jgi:tripartite-type tricarboxylate transporter receptor subunit TctC